MKTANIHNGINSTLMILQSRFKAKNNIPAIESVKHYGDLSLVECYAGQLNQVFMNILTNAIDVLDEVRSDRLQASQSPSWIPTITICTERLPADRIAIRISNNTPPVPETIQQRLFDPFFTTKPIGKGIGLGLSISYSIVTERHGGQLHCQSSSDQDTTFGIEIPQYQSGRKDKK